MLPEIKPRDPLRWRLIQIWEEVLRVSPVRLTNSLAELGGTLQQGERILSAITDVYGVSLPLSVSCMDLTVDRLAETVLAAWRCISPLREIQAGEKTRPPLFLLHGDIAGEGIYSVELSRKLRPDVPLYILPPHGLNGSEVLSSVEKMAAELLETLLKFRPHGVYCLAGFCSGGLIAFEIARLLKSLHRTVAALILIDAPLRSRLNRRKRDPWRSSFVPAGVMKSPRSRAAYIYSRFAIPVANYEPGIYHGKLLLFWSRDFIDSTESREAWSEVVTEVEFHSIPGNHFTSLSRYVGYLAEKMGPCLVTNGPQTTGS